MFGLKIELTKYDKLDPQHYAGSVAALPAFFIGQGI